MHVVAAPAHRTRHARLRMLNSPRDKLLVSGEYGVDQLIEHVLGRLAEKRRVRVQGLLILLIQAGAELDEALPTRAGFDDGHTHSFPERRARGGGRRLRAGPNQLATDRRPNRAPSHGTDLEPDCLDKQDTQSGRVTAIRSPPSLTTPPPYWGGSHTTTP